MKKVFEVLHDDINGGHTQISSLSGRSLFTVLTTTRPSSPIGGGGGGGGAPPIVVVSAGNKSLFTVLTSEGSSSMSRLMFPGESRSFTLIVKDVSDSDLSLNVKCEGSLCQYTSISPVDFVVNSGLEKFVILNVSLPYGVSYNSVFDGVFSGNSYPQCFNSSWINIGNNYTGGASSSLIGSAGSYAFDGDWNTYNSYFGGAWKHNTGSGGEDAIYEESMWWSTPNVTFKSNLVYNISNFSNSFVKNDNLSFGCNAFDGVSYSGWSNSSSVTILNSVPIIVSSRISPTTAFKNSTIQLYCNASDIDGFSGTTLNTSKWSKTAGVVTNVNNGIINISSTSGSQCVYGNLTGVTNISIYGKTFAFNVSSNNTANYGWFTFQSTSVSTDCGNGIAPDVRIDFVPVAPFFGVEVYNATKGVLKQFLPSYTVNAWYSWYVSVDNSGIINFTAYYNNGTLIGNWVSNVSVPNVSYSIYMSDYVTSGVLSVESIQQVVQVSSSNSCVYSGSGNWNINASDHCNISVTNLLKNNIILSGSFSNYECCTYGLRNVSNFTSLYVSNASWLW